MKRAALNSKKDREPHSSHASAAAPKKASVKEPADPKEQNQTFEEAMRLFHSRRYGEALMRFEAAAAGPNREMSHVARQHASMCEQRLGKTAPEPKTADDHYLYGVALLNRRDLEGAERHFREALKISENGDHLHYALALCRGLSGDLESAALHLRRAIELQPRNRSAARNDPDFAGIGSHPTLREILY